MNESQRITLDDTYQSAVLKLAEGNPGAVVVMGKLMTDSPKIDPQSAFGALSPLFALDAHGIYGPHIWLLYKDVCKQSTLNVEILFRATQLGMMSESVILNAIAAAERGPAPSIDFADWLAKVQARLPEFGLVSA